MYGEEDMRIMRILVACEESQAVTKQLRALGHIAYSCDIEPCSGGHPEWHIQGNVLRYLNGYTRFMLQDGSMGQLADRWDMIIAFPPCTYLTVTGNRWFNVEKYGEAAVKRHFDRMDAMDFFIRIVDADCDKIAIENPVGIMSTAYRKPDQIINPYDFGDPFEKRTCLWLKGLPLLKPTNTVKPPERQKIRGGKSMPAWYSNASKKDRAKIRAKTFPGIAKAMAEQWTKEV